MLEQLIAKYPLKLRDSCKILVFYKNSNELIEDRFDNILNYFEKNDLLVLSDSGVLKYYFRGRKTTNYKVSLLLIKKTSNIEGFSCVYSNHKIRMGDIISIGDFRITILSKRLFL